MGGHNQRVVVSCSMSRWRPVTSDIPQDFILGPVLFNAFINYDGIECALGKVVDDTKLSGAADTIEKRDLNRLEK